ncbi:thaumatin family protein [Sarocladium implicatum]|nr:thaumatin family protein [Sarocladium implicatum]
MRRSSRQASKRSTTSHWLIATTVCLGSFVSFGSAQLSPGIEPRQEAWQSKFFPKYKRASVPAKRGRASEDWDGRIPLVITNKCDDTIWPGITTQSGTGPGTGGFELVAGNSTRLWVAPDWQGRVWGRTNCTVDGDSCSCTTGDCSHKLDCESSGVTPATLAEFTLEGGLHGGQTFYDISLVDGYNLPMGINYIPAKNTSFIPPNLTNAACIATPGWLYKPNKTGTYYSNDSFPIPLEDSESNDSIKNWCPWPFLAFPPKKPGDGVYPYPDDDVQRPVFSPCNSACAATGKDSDCCVGKWHDPEKCKPGRYSNSIKAICPDAYSFAFDDQKSTFIIPKGGGWEVVMCPKGRSTNILRQLSQEMDELNNAGNLSEKTLRRLRDVQYITSDRGAASGVQPALGPLSGIAIAVGLWFYL